LGRTTTASERPPLARDEEGDDRVDTHRRRADPERGNEPVVEDRMGLVPTGPGEDRRENRNPEHAPT
jgi:hypothetical protein